MMARVSKTASSVRSAKAHPHPKRRPVHYSHRHHTGKKLPFHQTSYALIFFVLLFTIGCLFFVRQTIVSGQSASGEVQLSGLVPGPPPATAATIDQPTDNQRFNVNTITVSGTCDHDYIVEVYRNGGLAGSVVCSPTGSYDLMITLVAGSNELMARTRDIINQYGPDSATITIFYDVPPDDGDDDNPPPDNPPNPPSNPPSAPRAEDLLVTAKGYYRVDQTTKRLKLQLTLRGGVPSYQVVIRWGDGEQTVQEYTKAGKIQVAHVYQKPGQYRVTIEVTDSEGTRSVFQTVAIVDGVTEVSLGSTGTLSQRCQMDAVCIFQNQIVDGVNRLWPLFAVVSGVTLCFWFGEKVAVATIVKKATH